jgi:hypothetical protein
MPERKEDHQNLMPPEEAGDSEEALDHTGGAAGISNQVTERDEEYVRRHSEPGEIGEETPTKSGIGTTGTKREAPSGRD